MKTINPALILFIGFELCYYLLIAQTGIVEVFHSNLFIVGILPIGGVLGSIISSRAQIEIKYKVMIFLTLQLILSLIYPEYSMLQLFLLGFAVGAIAPLMMDTIKKASGVDMVLSLSIAYATGTFFFNTNPNERELFAVIFTIIAMVSYLFIDRFHKEISNNNNQYISYSLILMSFWVFLDSALFETLSRDINISIWRGGYTFEIMAFHIIGVIGGLVIRFDHYQKALFILVLFALSYFFYFLREPLLLSIVYPFVISYYNITILQSLYKIKSLKTLGIYMIFIGWAASGAGLFVAYLQIILFIPILFLIVILYMINQNTYFHKGVYHG